MGDTTSTAPATPTPTGPPRVSTRGRLSPATPPPLPTTLLAVTDTTSTAPATPTPTGLPRVLTASTRGPPSSLPSPPSPWSVVVSSALAFLAPMTRSTTEEGTT